MLWVSLGSPWNSKSLQWVQYGWNRPNSQVSSKYVFLFTNKMQSSSLYSCVWGKKLMISLMFNYCANVGREVTAVDFSSWNNYDGVTCDPSTWVPSSAKGFWQLPDFETLSSNLPILFQSSKLWWVIQVFRDQTFPSSERIASCGTSRSKMQTSNLLAQRGRICNPVQNRCTPSILLWKTSPSNLPSRRWFPST